mgnify:FL=1
MSLAGARTNWLLKVAFQHHCLLEPRVSEIGLERLHAIFAGESIRIHARANERPPSPQHTYWIERHRDRTNIRGSHRRQRKELVTVPVAREYDALFMNAGSRSFQGLLSLWPSVHLTTYLVHCKEPGNSTNKLWSHGE